MKKSSLNMIGEGGQRTYKGGRINAQFNGAYRNALVHIYEFLNENNHPLSKKINGMNLLELEDIRNKVMIMLENKNPKSGLESETDEDVLFNSTAMFFYIVMLKSDWGDADYNKFKEKFIAITLSKEEWVRAGTELFSRIRLQLNVALADYAPYHYRKNYIEKEFPEEGGF